MLLGCCHCGQEQSSSVASSAASSGGSAGSAIAGSDSLASGSVSQASGSLGFPVVTCNWCKNNVAPAVFKMEWMLENNCPNTQGSGTVDCYDQNVGPHGNIYARSETYSFIGMNCAYPLPEETCFWKNDSTGEVEIDIPSRGLCGQCSNGPSIVVAVSRYPAPEGSGRTYDYEMNCFVTYFFDCYFIDDPGPPVVGVTYLGNVFLHYRKAYLGLPPNCLFPQDLDLFCHSGFDEYTDPPGTTEWYGVGPGCNYSADYGTSFPSTVTISPDLGGGLFP